ncbi:17894_t:CDS:2, partial [Acaulospora morrowiae]
MSDKKIHEYFLIRESSKWNITDFLEESSEEPFEKKLDIYIKSLINLANSKRGKQRERALMLIDKYKEEIELQNQGWGTGDLIGSFAWCSRLIVDLALGSRPDRQEARKWNKERKSPRKVGGHSIHFYKSTIVESSVIGTNSGNFEDKKSKRKRENLEENARKRLSLDTKNDQSMLYDKAIAEINTAREDKMACRMMPLCWGIIDLRAENVSPCPKHPRAKELLTQDEVIRLQQITTKFINKGSQLNPSTLALLEVLQSSTFSLKKFCKEKRAQGIKGICSLLHIKTDKVDIYDKDTQYIGECLDAFNEWVRTYGGVTHIERTVDMHLIGPFSKTPNVKFIYGESHSYADRDEKSSRSPSERTGKSCDFIFWKNGNEVGIGENTGPTHKDHHKKSITDFVDVIKVARAQHISFQTKCIEKSRNNPLPLDIRNKLRLIPIPFFQVIGMKIRFYILIQIEGDLYGIWEWSSQDLPKKEDDIITAVFLCKKFLIHRNLLNRTGRLSKKVITDSRIFGENVENMRVIQHAKAPIKLNSIITPRIRKE